MKGWLAGLVLCAAGPAMAGDAWANLGGARLTAMLAGHTLDYADGTRQSFRADGGTTFWDKAGVQSRGRWGARGDRYCSVWPPSDTWVCYGVAAKGDAVRFTDDAGAVTEGRLVAE